MSAREEIVFSNARIITGDQVVTGCLTASGGLVRHIDEGATSQPGAVDCEGDYLAPGLVELHTDNLERHLRPRPGVNWPYEASLIAHDAEFAAAGVTTVLDALRLGPEHGEDGGLGRDAAAVGAAAADLRSRDLLRADHYVHLRCELSSASLMPDFDRAWAEPTLTSRLRLISIMDHTPGARQFADVSEYAKYYQNLRGYSDEELEVFVQTIVAQGREKAGANRETLKHRLSAATCAIASHDDATEAHVGEALDIGSTVSEFPTTELAARSGRKAGMRTIMGAPNLMRGGSHNGNVSALDLARLGMVDALSSDYAPGSLLAAAFRMSDLVADISVPAAIACVSRHPAEMAGFKDRGEIAPGLRADFVRVQRSGDLSVVRGVWRSGRRVA